MRVLQVGMSYNPGGVESFVMNYCRRLSKQGIWFDFICMYDRLAYEEEIRELGGKIFCLPNVKKNPAAFADKFRKILLKERYEIVHVNMLSAANILPLKIAYQAGVKKIIAHAHNTQTPGIIRKMLHALNQKKIARYANAYWACSKEAGNWLFGKWVAKENIQVVSNAIEPKQYRFSENARTEIRSELNLDGNTCVVLHVGRMEPQKNHMFLVDIYEAFLQKEPDSVLLLAGDGKLKQEIFRKAEQKKIEGHIFFLGVRKDIAKLYSAADVFCFPSLFEGLSLTAVEAQANGLNCIFSDGVGRETIFAPNVKTIRLKDSPAVWADGICRMKGKSKRNETENAKRLALVKQAGFDIEEQAEKIADLYRSG